MAVCEFRPPSRTPWSLCQEPKTARFPRIARLSPGPRRVGPPCARERRVAGSTTRTAGSSRSRGEGRECIEVVKVLAAVGLGSTSPSASLRAMSVPTTPVTSWAESCSPVGRARRLVAGPSTSRPSASALDLTEPTAVAIRLDVPELYRAVVIRRPSHSVVRSRWGVGKDRLCRREHSHRGNSVAMRAVVGSLVALQHRRSVRAEDDRRNAAGCWRGRGARSHTGRPRCLGLSLSGATCEGEADGERQ